MFIRSSEYDSFWKNKRKRKIFIWLVVLALLAVSGSAGFILASNEPRVVQVTPAPPDLPVGADDSKIEKGAVVKWEYQYKMCGHTVYLSCMADDHLTGLTFSQLQAEYPDARIISFEPEMVSLKLSFDCYCPRHYILKRYKDALAVFRTILGSDEQETYRNVPIKFDSLCAEEQEVLEAGKLFESIGELESYLENIDS